jgi:hypothetical protein
MKPERRQGAGRLAVSVAAAACFALSLTACSSGSPARSVASLPGDSSKSRAPATSFTEAQSDQAILSYARCLRSHGLNEPDPTTNRGHAGLSLEIPADTPANQPALSTCSHFIAKFVAAKEAGASQQLSQWLPALVRYASCMRSHDIDMLDPGPQGQLNLGNVPGITSDFGRYSPQFRSADAACRHLLPRGVHDDGTGP